MKKADLERWEATLMDLVVKRRQLGEYNSDAGAILVMGEALMRLYQHNVENAQSDKPTKNRTVLLTAAERGMGKEVGLSDADVARAKLAGIDIFNIDALRLWKSTPKKKKNETD